MSRSYGTPFASEGNRCQAETERRSESLFKYVKSQFQMAHQLNQLPTKQTAIQKSSHRVIVKITGFSLPMIERII